MPDLARVRTETGKHVFGDENFDAARCVRIVQRMAANYDGFTAVVKTFACCASRKTTT
jgi:hypothetical protein